MTIKNSQGKVYYGMHFYPGVATARPDPDKPEITVYLNESTIRSMDASFTARPVYVLHVDEVDDDLDEMRKTVDGYVVESFYNAADGKHWAKMIICSERGIAAIEQGMRLSNCYVPKSFNPGGVWNGVKYNREVTSAEYEHMAIVPNPRYDESVIMTPEQFHAYNGSQAEQVELNRLANDNQKGEKTVALKLKLFTRKKVENATIDLEETMVVLPKTGKEVTLAFCVQNADLEGPLLANGDSMVEYGGTKMTVNALMEKHGKVCDELEKMKKTKGNPDGEDEEEEDMENDDDMSDDVEMENDDDMDDDVDNDMEIDEEKESEVKAAKKADKTQNAKDAKKKVVPVKNESDKKKKTPEERAKARDKAERLKNARAVAEEGDDEVIAIETSEDQVARGIARYG